MSRNETHLSVSVPVFDAAAMPVASLEVLATLPADPGRLIAPVRFRRRPGVESGGADPAPGRWIGHRRDPGLGAAGRTLPAVSPPDANPPFAPHLTTAAWDAILAAVRSTGSVEGPPEFVLPFLASMAADSWTYPQRRIWAAATLIPHDRQRAVSLLDGFVGDLSFRTSDKAAYWYFIAAAVLVCVDRQRGADALARLAGGTERTPEPEDDDQRLAHRLLRLLTD